MKEKLKYINRKGTPYYFREVSGKRGSQIVCSKSESENDLVGIPDTHEIVESPNGQVSCRKIMKCDLLPEEILLTKKLCPKLVEKDVRIIVEVKKKELVLHSANTESINELAKFMTGFRSSRKDALASLAGTLRFEAVLKLELSNKAERTFSAFRKCWVGSRPEWLYLADGSLKNLLKKYVSHIEQESFFELC